MLVKAILHILIFIYLSQNFVTAELVNNHQWIAVLSSLNIKSLKETRSSLTEKANDSLRVEHIKICLDQIKNCYREIQNEYSTFLAIYFT
jgi:hypothetical protein